MLLVLLCYQLPPQLCFELLVHLYFPFLLLHPEHLYSHLVFLVHLYYLQHPEHPVLCFVHLEHLYYLLDLSLLEHLV